MASSSSSKKEEHNYLRLNLLVVKLSTAVLKARFSKSIPPKRLCKKLKKSIGKIDIGKEKKIISQKQYDLLFPQNGTPNSDVFDVTLLVYLLRHVCGLDGKSRWWTEKDNKNIPDTVVDEVADIVRIRNVRNEIQHSQAASIEQKEFEETWEVTEKAILRLSEVCGMKEVPKEIEIIKNQPFDTVQEKVVVIMKSHGFDNDYRYYDDDDEFYDYDDYDDYDDCDDYDDDDDSYYSDDSDSEYSDYESDYRRDRKYKRSERDDEDDDYYDDDDRGYRYKSRDSYKKDYDNRYRDRDYSDDEHDDEYYRKRRYSDEDSDDYSINKRRKYSDDIDDRERYRDRNRDERYDREHYD